MYHVNLIVLCLQVNDNNNNSFLYQFCGSTALWPADLFLELPQGVALCTQQFLPHDDAPATPTLDILVLIPICQIMFHH
ncbi:hypothetical protein CsSME_00012089 [Camellia sinensis var. sinensis]